MAVSILNAWSGETAGDPDGAAPTISAGSERVAVLQYFAEIDALTLTTITMGGQSPTGQLLSERNNGAENNFCWTFYWNEAAVAAMSGTSVVFTLSDTVIKEHWGFAVYQDAGGAISFATAVSEAATQVFTFTNIPTNTSGDYVITTINRSSKNRDIISWGSLTEVWQYNTQDYTIGIADGVGVGTFDITGDQFDGDGVGNLLVIAEAAGGGGNMYGKLHHEMREMY